MIIAALIIAYLAVGLLCAYLEGRITGYSDFALAWVIWPILLPGVLVSAAFSAVGNLGERHG